MDRRHNLQARSRTFLVGFEGHGAAAYARSLGDEQRAKCTKTILRGLLDKSEAEPASVWVTAAMAADILASRSQPTIKVPRRVCVHMTLVAKLLDRALLSVLAVGDERKIDSIDGGPFEASICRRLTCSWRSHRPSDLTDSRTRLRPKAEALDPGLRIELTCQEDGTVSGQSDCSMDLCPLSRWCQMPSARSASSEERRLTCARSGRGVLAAHHEPRPGLADERSLTSDWITAAVSNHDGTGVT